MSIDVRPMRADDVAYIAAVHLDAFPGFFLSFLGRRFLQELYRAILADRNGIAFVAVGETGVIGFVAGSADSSGFYRRVARRRWWRFGFASIHALLRRPAIMRRLLRALVAPPRSGMEGALLMSLAVDPRVQRTGAGRLLSGAFVEEAARRGAKAVVLTTDRRENDAANAFYLSQSFQLVRSYATPEGRAMNEYIMYI